jgi:hypothetical protein
VPGIRESDWQGMQTGTAVLLRGRYWVTGYTEPFHRACRIGFLKVLNPAAVSTEILHDRKILHSSNSPGDLEGHWRFGKSAGSSESRGIPAHMERYWRIRG